MLLIKNLKSYNFLYVPFFLLTLSSCSFYKTIDIDPISIQSLKSVYETKRTIIVHDDKEDMEYVLTNVVIENDSVKGIIAFAPSGAKHKHHKKSFTRKKVRAYNPKEVIHIYTSMKDVMPDSIGIHIDAIRFIEIHKKDVGKSFITSFGIVIGSAAIITVAGFTAFILSYNG